MVPGGGSVELGQLIDKHGKALAYDLQTIGVDLRDLWRDGSTLTPRWVLWLAEQLPDDSAFVASCRGGRRWRAWNFNNQLLAAAVNQLAAANAQRAHKRPRPVISLPRLERQRNAKVVSVAEIAARQRKSQANRG